MRPPSNSGRGARAAALLAAVLVLTACGLVLAGSAAADVLTPEAGPTKNAQDIDTLYKIVLGLAVVMIGLVWGVLFYSLFRFRARRGRVPPQIRGNDSLELTWTLASAGLVIVIAVATLVLLPGIRSPQASGPASVAEARGLNADISQPPPKGKAVTIIVSGQQYIWRFQYPNGAVSFEEMVAPKDVTVILKIKANDVAHSWWIPKLGPKFDALPGYTNESWFKATATGTFVGQCAELCGENHAFMRARVTVLDLPQYLEWVRRQKILIAESQKAVQIQRKTIEAAAG
jgi:cytochrome c oxidase subunit II